MIITRSVAATHCIKLFVVVVVDVGDVDDATYLHVEWIKYSENKNHEISGSIPSRKHNFFSLFNEPGNKTK